MIAVQPLSLSSPAFLPGEFIPEKYTCEGENINPPLIIGNIPDGTRSLVLFMNDTDAYYGNFDHWIVWNIPVTRAISENSIPGNVAKNSTGQNNYVGPRAPNVTHHYHIKIYALDMMLQLQKDADKKTIEDAMRDHILSKGEIVGLYKKKIQKIKS